MTQPETLFPDLDLQSKKPKRQESGLLDFGVSYDTTPTPTGQVSGPMFKVQDSDSGD